MNDDFRDEPNRRNVDGRFASDHPHALLPAYATGSLEPLAAARIRAHLGACGSCQRELAEWRAVGDAVREVGAQAGLPRPTVLRGALATIARDGERRPGVKRTSGIFERMKDMLQSQNRRPPRGLVAAAAAAVLAAAVVFTPVGSYAQGVLTIFTPKQIAAVPVTEQDLASLPKLNNYGTFTMPQHAASQTQHAA
ncbi:MAG TPA: zf-HC2 domain-containing protein, partial [Chloroflexota bacterium]|nr:zf-HC2 domain-containing protein [Chloroflexota bacterium]